MNRVKNVNKTNQFKTKWENEEAERESQLHLGREKENPVTSGEGKRKIPLLPGRENRNPVTSGQEEGVPVTSGEIKRNSSYRSGEAKGKSSYIRGGIIKIQLHPGREKRIPVPSGERKGKSSYIRGGKREIQLHPRR